MSAKINKNGKEYPLGFVPQSLYNDVEDLKDFKENGGTFGGNVTIDRQNGTTSSVGITELVIGNNKGQGVDKNSRGFLYLFSTTGKWVGLRNDHGTANREIYFPDKSGTLALVEDFTPVNIKSDFNVAGIQSLFKMGKLVEAVIKVTPTAIDHGTVIISKLPIPYGAPKYLTLGMANGQSIPCIIDKVSGQNYAQLMTYYPIGGQIASRIDATITYFADI